MRRWFLILRLLVQFILRLLLMVQLGLILVAHVREVDILNHVGGEEHPQEGEELVLQFRVRTEVV
jgi:hypothetical protein